MTLIRPVLALAGGVLLLGAVAACGSSDGSDAAASTGNAGSAAEAGGAPSGASTDGARGGFPGASGLVADISGKTLQVQGQSGQTAVTYTGTTTFTAQVSGSLSDIKVGTCVQASSADTGSSSAGSEQSEMPTEITASTVRIIAATDGSCSRGGMGGGQGAGIGGPSGDASGGPSDMPSGMPTDMPSGAAGGRGGFGGFGAFGEVTAVTATGFTVSQQSFGQDASSGDTTEVAVTVGSDTTYTKTAASSARALAVGKCVTATGDTDDTGALTAESIAISDAVDGECTGGFGGFGGGRLQQGSGA